MKCARHFALFIFPFKDVIGQLSHDVIVQFSHDVIGQLSRDFIGREECNSDYFVVGNFNPFVRQAFIVFIY